MTTITERPHEKLLNQARWWLSRREKTEYHEAMAYACLFEWRIQLDIHHPRSYKLVGRPTVAQRLIQAFQQNPELVNDL